jgi:hypothetical protein
MAGCIVAQICCKADFKFERCCFGIIFVFPIVILWAIWKEITTLIKVLKEKENE